jgi:uncharacterized membrane protein
MLRKAAAKKIESHNKSFHLRGHEVRRIETFSDAVFAFAVTLLIVSLEVPKSFEELLITMRGFFAFGISFLFLMFIWHEQNVFFRRYGLEDIATISLNCTLMFIVLFFVYPLKFLFTIIVSGNMYGDNAIQQMTSLQNSQLMSIYGLGFVAIYFLFFAMYRHALRKKDELQLTASECFDTRTKMYSHLVFISIGITSIILAWILPPSLAGLAGIFYCIIGPALTVFFSYRGKRKRMLHL